MGEIRSTLDIIMEKARGVKVTDEDKAGFIRREIEGRIRGLLQKALDGLSDEEGIKSEIEALGIDRRDMARAALRRDCLDRLALEGDNALLLNLMAHIAGLDTTPVEEILLRYREDMQTRRVHREAALRECLRGRGISGSAVVPNIETDPEWIRLSTDARDRFHREIAGLRL